jgi:hypothetical protein
MDCNRHGRAVIPRFRLRGGRFSSGSRFTISALVKEGVSGTRLSRIFHYAKLDYTGSWIKLVIAIRSQNLVVLKSEIVMAITLKVKWVEQYDQPGLGQRIRRIGGVAGELQWRHTQAAAIESIERGQFAYYVEQGARAIHLFVALDADGKKYLAILPGRSQALYDMPTFPKPAEESLSV